MYTLHFTVLETLDADRQALRQMVAQVIVKQGTEYEGA